METVDDVLDGLESGVQHAFQAGIDRVNQTAKTLSHEIKDWRIMPLPFTYSVCMIYVPVRASWLYYQSIVVEKNHYCVNVIIFFRTGN